jgi:hypothetical protein
MMGVYEWFLTRESDNNPSARTIEMSDKPPPRQTLREMELEVMAEGREWMRRRLQEKLQQQAEREGRVFPPQPTESPTPADAEDETADGRRGD